MAPKDYVKRAKAPAKQQAKRRKSNKQTKAPLPWIKVSVSIIVIAAFVFGLYKLQSISDGDDDYSETTKADESSLSEAFSNQALEIDQPQLDTLEQTELPELPVLGEEEWEYIDSLPDFSVEVDATGPLESDKDFIMQCGSFRTSARAEELKAKIAFQGLESRILTSNGRNGLWYRVVLGPYERKRNAERHRHQLRKGKVNGCKIW